MQQLKLRFDKEFIFINLLNQNTQVKLSGYKPSNHKGFPSIIQLDYLTGITYEK